MNEQINNGGPVCKWCDQPAHIKWGRIALCAVHGRMAKMRAKAKCSGKDVPSYSELYDMVPHDMRCIGCRRTMNWLRSEGTSTQATLQHDRSGDMKIICLACNTRHAIHPGDSYYSIPSTHKLCPDCKLVLPKNSFARDRSRPLGLKSYCRKCSTQRQLKWQEKNRESYNAKQREYRAKRKANGNPVSGGT